MQNYNLAKYFKQNQHQCQHYCSTSTKQTGFTLIELLIVTSLTVLLMLTITTLFMTFLIGNSKTNVRKSVKEEGLHAMNQMEFIIKNAHYVEGTCEPTGNTISITGLDGGTSTYSNQDEKIASSSAFSANSFTSYLTSSAVKLSGLNFECTGPVGNRQIKINFSLNKNAPTLGEDSDISESFETTINIRN